MFITIDDAIELLQQFKKESRLGGNAVLHLCEFDRPYEPVTGMSLDESSEDGSVVCFHILNQWEP